MTGASLVVETASLRFRPDGPATGNVWLVLNGQEFPMRGWNDFVVVILGWWAAALLLVLRNESPHEMVEFMDGPYAVEVSRTLSGTLWFRALEGPGRNSEVVIGEGLIKPFAVGLVAQSREVLNACRRQGWWSEDAETLQSALEDLEQELSRFLS